MKLAIITGGSKGLGKALCNQFEMNEYEVVEFSRSGATDYSIPCDFADYESATNIVQNKLKLLAEKSYEEIVLINNVGTISPIGPIAVHSPKEYKDNVHINFLSSIMVSGVFSNCFQDHKCLKTIIYISSGAVARPKYGWSLYCGVKAGLEQFFKSYSLEQSKCEHPIRVVTCDPGIIDTSMQEAIRNSKEELFPEKSRFIGFKNNEELMPAEYVAKEIYLKCLNTTESYIEI